MKILISKLCKCVVKIRSSQTTCQTLDNNFIRWEDGSMTSARQSSEAHMQSRPLADGRERRSKEL